VERIAELPLLETLSLGIYELDTLAVLERVPSNLFGLWLGQTKSKKPDLAPLARFSQLRTLHIEGHTRSIGVLEGLTSLEDLTLRSTTTPDLAFLAPLSRLWSLDITLGGTTNLSAIAGMSTIKYLELGARPQIHSRHRYRRRRRPVAPGEHARELRVMASWKFQVSLCQGVERSA